MKHFKLLNVKERNKKQKKTAVSEKAICLCSHGVDECWHCGRGSKP